MHSFANSAPHPVPPRTVPSSSDADDVDLLSVVHLIPDRLEDLANRRALGVAAVHQAGDVLETDVAGLQLLVIEDADAAPARVGVAVEGEVDFFDAVALGAFAERGFGAGGGATEQDAVGRFIEM